jgi:magnesium-transporting ATPase (P-type)
MDLF